MGRYLTKRILLGAFSLWVLVSICFFLLRFLPGSPFLEDEAVHPLLRQYYENSLGLNDSLPLQYLKYVSALSQGDLGQSLGSPERSVASILEERLKVSLTLGGMALVVVLLFAFLFAWSFSRSERRLRLGMGFSIFAFAVPGLILAPVLVDFFALRLGLLPVARIDQWQGYILPIAAISFRPICRLGQILAQEIRRLSQADAARTFKSLGFGEKRIVFYWILPEAFVAVLAQMGSLIAQLLAGSFFVEIVFSIPGLGSLFADALSARDYPVVLGIALWIGTLVFVGQLLVDILMGLLDPRIRPEETGT